MIRHNANKQKCKELMARMRPLREEERRNVRKRQIGKERREEKRYK
jgi:hypothetical protein